MSYSKIEPKFLPFFIKSDDGRLYLRRQQEILTSKQWKRLIVSEKIAFVYLILGDLGYPEDDISFMEEPETLHKDHIKNDEEQFAFLDEGEYANILEWQGLLRELSLQRHLEPIEILVNKVEDIVENDGLPITAKKASLNGLRMRYLRKQALCDPQSDKHKIQSSIITYLDSVLEGLYDDSRISGKENTKKPLKILKHDMPNLNQVEISLFFYYERSAHLFTRKGLDNTEIAEMMSKISGYQYEPFRQGLSKVEPYQFKCNRKNFNHLIAHLKELLSRIEKDIPEY